jgi:hypothetical protein
MRNRVLFTTYLQGDYAAGQRTLVVPPHAPVGTFAS